MWLSFPLIRHFSEYQSINIGNKPRQKKYKDGTSTCGVQTKGSLSIYAGGGCSSPLLGAVAGARRSTFAFWKLLYRKLSATQSTTLASVKISDKLSLSGKREKNLHTFGSNKSSLHFLFPLACFFTCASFGQLPAALPCLLRLQESGRRDFL